MSYVSWTKEVTINVVIAKPLAEGTMYEWPIVFQSLCKELWCSYIAVYYGQEHGAQLSFGLLAEGSSFHQRTRQITCPTVLQGNTSGQCGGEKIPTASFLQLSAA